MKMNLIQELQWISDLEDVDHDITVIADAAIAEVTRLQNRVQQGLDYNIALQRAIEHYCRNKPIPDAIASRCPHHVALLEQAANTRRKEALQ